MSVPRPTAAPATAEPVAHRSWLPYQPGLDGLRALAVIGVMAYHADLSSVPGGFLGVEVFFVLSGYLITSLLLAEWHRGRHIDLKAFWLRRARRLFPALLLLVGSVLAYAVLVLPEEVAGLRTDALAAIGCATNWYLVFARESYFEAVGRPSLLRHLWALAVEAQFYLLWPLFLTVALRSLSRRRLLASILVAATTSTMLLALLYDPYVDPSRVYFGTDTRATGLLVGAALALVWAPGKQKGQGLWNGRTGAVWLDLIGLTALGALVGSSMLIDEFQPWLYRGGFALVVLAAASVIAASVHPSSPLLSRLLGTPPLRWLGRRSYGLYLWHWPVFMVTRPHLDLPMDGPQLLILRLLVTGLVAELSYRLVEKPVRIGMLGRAWRHLRQAHGTHRLWLSAQWVLSIGALISLCVVLGQPIATAASPEPPEYLAIESVDTIGSPGAAARPSTAQLVDTTTVSTSTLAVTPSAQPATKTVRVEPGPATPIALGTAALDSGTAPVVAIPSSLPPSLTFSPTPLTTSSPTALPTAASTEPARLPITSSLSAQPYLPQLLPSEGRSTEFETTPTPKPGSPITVTAFGDSVMLGAVAELEQAIEHVQVDAAVGRQALHAVRTLRERRDAGQLGTIVVIHLGSNGLFREEQFDEIMQVLAGVDKVMFVNVRVLRRWQDPVNKMLAEGVTRHTSATVIDWYATSTDRPELLREDGVHLSSEGAQVYAELIAACVKAVGYQ